MTEGQFIEQILLNLGDKAPWLLAFFIFVRWMWPDLRTFLLEYLKIREQRSEQGDPVTTNLGVMQSNQAAMQSNLAAVQTTLAGLATSLQQFIDESRRAQSENAGMVRTVVGLVSAVQSERLATFKLASEQPPVSPTEVAGGEVVGDKAARAVQT